MSYSLAAPENTRVLDGGYWLVFLAPIQANPVFSRVWSHKEKVKRILSVYGHHSIYELLQRLRGTAFTESYRIPATWDTSNGVTVDALI